MLPQNDSILNLEPAARQPDATYRIDFEKRRINARCDGLEAVRQAIYKILNTERYEHLIYSWNYGVELGELIGKPKGYVLPEIKRKIEEALTQDDRITGVDAFSFETKKRMVQVTFIVHTVYGDITAEKEVGV